MSFDFSALFSGANPSGDLFQETLFAGGDRGGTADFWGFYEDAAGQDTLWYDADGFNTGNDAVAVADFGTEDVSLDADDITIDPGSLLLG